MAEFNAAELLRADAILVARESLDRIPVEAADREWGPSNDYPQFLEAVELRFNNRLDGAGDGDGSTLARLMRLVQSYCFGGLKRSQLHAQVCVLLIGHADLFNRFENLQFMNDGRDETRHQITQWRNNLRNAVMPTIDVVLAECLSAIEMLNSNPMPGTLDGRDLNFIAAIFSPVLSVDPNNQFHDVMANLVTNPTGFGNLVLPILEQFQEGLHQVDFFLRQYFDLVALGGL